MLQNKIESNPLCIQNGMRNSLLEKTDYALLGPSNLNGIHSTYAPAVVDSVFTKEDSCWLRALPWVQEFSNSYHIYSITVELNLWIWNGFGIFHLVGIHVHLHHQYRMELRMLYGVKQCLGRRHVKYGLWHFVIDLQEFVGTYHELTLHGIVWNWERGIV